MEQLTASEPGHQQPLIDILNEIKNIKVVDSNDISFVNWMLFGKGEYPINLGFASKDSTIMRVTLYVERTKKLEWSCLQQHLERSQLAIEIQEWKQMMSDDLQARLGLLNAIIRKTNSALQNITFYSDLSDYNFNKAKPPYFTLYYIQTIYEHVFNKLISGNMADIESSHFLENYVNLPINRVVLGSPNLVIMCSNSQDERNNAKSFLLKSQSSLTELPEAQTVRDAYSKVKNQTEICTDEIKGIAVLDKRLPLGSKCERCKKMMEI